MTNLSLWLCGGSGKTAVKRRQIHEESTSAAVWGGGGKTAVKRRQTHDESVSAAVVKWWQNCGKTDKNAIYEF